MYVALNLFYNRLAMLMVMLCGYVRPSSLFFVRLDRRSKGLQGHQAQDDQTHGQQLQVSHGLLWYRRLRCSRDSLRVELKIG